MARNMKPADRGFLLFDVVYQDGTRTLHSMVPPGTALDPFDRATSICTLLERQDRKTAESSGTPSAA